MTNHSKVQRCLARVAKLKREKRAELSQEVMTFLEGRLGVTLPKPFKLLCNFYGYDFFRFFEFYNFEQESGVIGETLYYREHYGLPKNYLVLAYDEVSFVIMKIISEEQSEVIWCDEEDFFNLCAGKPFEYEVTRFPTFTDFYEFLIDEEEKRITEEAEEAEEAEESGSDSN